MQRDLFISYSSTDAALAMSVVTDFERHGISCWIASRDVPIGSAYQAEVVDAINDCRAMLLLFSGAANKSEHVLREVELAAQGRKPIYPLRIDAVEPIGGLKYMLANKQWVERRALGDRLVETIDQLLRASRDADQPSVPPSPPPAAAARRSPLLMGAVAGGAAVIVVLGAAWLIISRPGPAPQQTAAVTPAAQVAQPVQATQPPQAPPQPASPPQAPPPVQAPPPQTTQPVPTPPSSPPPQAENVIPAPLPTVVAALPAPNARPKSLLMKIEPRAHPVPRDVADAGYFFRECDECPVMSVIGRGPFAMGSPDDEPGHSSGEAPRKQIWFENEFAVGRTEVTFREWFACVAEGGCRAYRPGDYGWGTGTRPVINVSWADATAYVEWLSRKTGARYRLLSEAEWEYVARGCKSACPATAFWFGNTIRPDWANYDWRYSYEGSPKAQALRKTVDAESGEMNAFGLLHILGNVREWVQDCWNPDLSGISPDGSVRTSGDCSRRVVRGGSWDDQPKDLRSAKRGWELPDERRAQTGFRVARSF